MEITIAIVVMVVTLIAGEIVKVIKIPSKYIPLQNLVIAIVSSIVCIIFKVEGLSVLETILTCVFATMAAGGIADMKKVMQKNNEENSNIEKN